MKSLRPHTFAVGLMVCISAAPLTAAAQEAPPAAAAAQGVVEPDAVAALKRMSDYLTGLNTIEITSDSSLDVVTMDGQRVQLDGVTKYKIRKPGFVIDYASDLKSRRFIYDGRNLTVESPKLGFYATVPAPRTNREVLDLAYQTYGIKLPLEDLFRWNDPSNARAASFRSAYKLGTSTLDGVPTDHYAFREDTIDWEIWIQQGAQPVPRKVVIVDRTDPMLPAFTARLDWKPNAPLTDADFAFRPREGAQRIELATFQGPGE